MITCGKCGRENHDHYKFCLGCGNPLSAPEPEPAEAESVDEAPEEIAAEPAPEPPAEAAFVTCPECASRVATGKKFCASCGALIPKDAEAAPDEAPEEPAAKTAEPAHDGDAIGSLTMVNPDGSAGDSVPLYDGPNTVGRNSSADVLRRDEYLSPEHATLSKADGGIRIEDHGSINGTFYRIDGPTEVAPGDYIRLGQEVFLFQAAGDFPVDASIDPKHGSEQGDIWGRIARISGPEGQASNAFLLWKDEHSIGRERGDYTVPDDGFVSGLHARIYRDGNSVFVEDLQSSNGTFLRIKDAHVIPNGTLILMGKQPFRVQLND